MDISRSEFQLLLDQFWSLPEGTKDEQMEHAAMIAIAVESHPEFGKVMYRSVQDRIEAPAFPIKAFMLKRALANDREFDQWLAGIQAVAPKARQASPDQEPSKSRTGWWRFWK